MTAPTLQQLCELGQQQLMATEYLRAETTLVAAEKLALEQRDFDTLSRLYMPLQETRRQKRQRCGEGVVCLDLLSIGPNDRINGRHVVENYPHAQLLVGGWGSIESALEVRELAEKHELYVETFLAAVYPINDGRAVVIAPLKETRLPDLKPRTFEELAGQLPERCLVLRDSELLRGSHRGTAKTFADVMAMWERLHAPFLANADKRADSMQKIEGYRKTIRVDNACELAHQKLSDVARNFESPVA